MLLWAQMRATAFMRRERVAVTTQAAETQQQGKGT